MSPSGFPVKFAAQQTLHVAVGVIVSRQSEVLISRRHADVHQGELWEFPGGKVECGESVEETLRRELFEELAITVESARPLIKVRHTYSDAKVLLDVWRVDSFSGQAEGLEGQPIKWVSVDSLANYRFPEANLPILTAARLPEVYAILDYDSVKDEAEFSLWLERVLRLGVRLVQLRAKSLSSTAYEALSRKVCRRCEPEKVKVLLNSTPEVAIKVGAAGVHLTSKRLLSLQKRPLGSRFWVAASCHTREELRHAQKIGVDFAVLGPVMATKSHPGADTLGWDRFEGLVSEVSFPVYALGGLWREQVDCVRRRGGQGIAGIRAFFAD
ncbi:MAG: Nudix family hydrolase [Pseudomonadota bacterium]